MNGWKDRWTTLWLVKYGSYNIYTIGLLKEFSNAQKTFNAASIQLILRQRAHRAQFEYLDLSKKNK